VNWRAGVVAGTALLLGGCLVGPDYERPDIPAPDDYDLRDGFTTDEGESIVNLQWFEILGDPDLDTLIRVALEENRDLLTAIARVEEARAQLGFERADYFPQIDGQATGRRGDLFANQIPGLGVQENYVLAANLSWELDLWGKIRRSNESARAQLLQSQEARNQVLITLIADVASAYLLLLDLDDRVNIAKETLRTRTESTGIIQARFDEGIVPLLDVNQAEIQEYDAAAQLAALIRDREQTENLLSILVGRNPGPVMRNRELTNLNMPEAVPAGLPSELLERRPDIREAEAALAAQTALIGVAKANRFPSLNLTGTLGLASNDLDNFLSSDNKTWSVGADFVGPIFDAGKRRSLVEAEEARTLQLSYQYEQRILQALAEVEDSLIAIRTLQDELLAREKQVAAARSASMLSRARYDGGVTSYLEVLESERSKFNAELAESIIRRERLVSLVELYKALGGGWVPEEQ